MKQDIKPYDENGLRHGEWLIYLRNGKLEFRWNYVHQVNHGLFEGYNIDGWLRYRGNYNMGKEIGYWYYYGQKEYYLRLI